MPRLLIRSVEFEGPYYETWPPASHRRVFIKSEHRGDTAEYAAEVIRAFANRAFRRPTTKLEVAALMSVWKNSFDTTGDFRAAVKDALLVVLTSPQFLFLIEASETPQPEPIAAHELASKLSYFLWNAPPDERLLKLAKADRLRAALDDEVDQLIDDPKFEQFTREFRRAMAEP